MKKVFYSVCVFIGIQALVIAAGTWTPGELEIHMLDVGQGMSQLVISPIGKTLLLDCPEQNWNSSKTAKFVAGEIKRITGGTHVNYILASHLHLDHMGYVGKGGIWGLLNKYGITCDKLIDRDAGVWVDLNNNGEYDDGEIEWHNAGTTSGTGEKWIAWVTNPASDIYSKREPAVLGSTDQIKLGGDVKVQIVETDGIGATEEDHKTLITGDHTKDKVAPSENDYSISVLVSFHDFDYVFGGDTDGEYSKSSFGYCYNDVEEVVAKNIHRKVEVVSANHHGSQHSSSSGYLNTLVPEVVLYNVGENSFSHPTTPVVERFHQLGAEEYFTEKGNLELSGSYLHVVNGEIVIKTKDGKTFTVNGTPYSCYALNSKLL